MDCLLPEQSESSKGNPETLETEACREAGDFSFGGQGVLRGPGQRICFLIEAFKQSCMPFNPLPSPGTAFMKAFNRPQPGRMDIAPAGRRASSQTRQQSSGPNTMVRRLNWDLRFKMGY